MQHLERICSRNPTQDTFAPWALELFCASSLTPHGWIEFSGGTSPKCVGKSASPRSPPLLQGETGDYPHCLCGSQTGAELAPNRKHHGGSSPSRSRQVSQCRQASEQQAELGRRWSLGAQLRALSSAAPAPPGQGSSGLVGIVPLVSCCLWT